MSVAYHTFTDFNIALGVIEGIRKIYDGPLTLADDLLVWNIVTDGVRVWRVIGSEEALPAAPPEPAGPPDRSERIERSDWLNAGALNWSNSRSIFACLSPQLAGLGDKFPCDSCPGEFCSTLHSGISRRNGDLDRDRPC